MESLYVAVFTARRILRYRRISIIWGFCHPTIGYAIIVGCRTSILDWCSCARHDGRRSHDDDDYGGRTNVKDGRLWRMAHVWWGRVNSQLEWPSYDHLGCDTTSFHRLLLRNVHGRNSQPVSVQYARRKAKNEAGEEEKNGSRWTRKCSCNWNWA